MTFDDLNINKLLLNALQDLEYSTPTAIQEKVFSVAMSGKDICGIAQTGTGKTLAYLLPILRQYQYSKDKLPQSLIIVPTRELVVQVLESIQKLSAYMSVTALGIYGGVNVKSQITEISKGTDILVATPGRLLDLMTSGILKTKAIKRLVIDEVDEMFNLGFQTQINGILDLLPVRRQNLLFSATMTADVEVLINTFFNNPVKIEAAPAGTPLDNISQFGYLLPNFYTKLNLLKLFMSQNQDMTKVLVFVSTKQLADDIYEELSNLYPDKIGAIHSNKAQNTRFNTVNAFNDGHYRFLIATDIIARGLDVAEVSHVINFDMHEVPENYIHRIGRTGRLDKKGIAISFITKNDTEHQEKIEILMNYQIPIVDLPKELEISDKLTDDEMPQIQMKTVLQKIPKRENVGASTHEKSAKNQKVNVRRNHAAEMKVKYGKSYRKKHD